MAVSKTRAITVFGKTDLGGVAWPYGVGAQQRRPHDWSEDRYAEHLKDREEAQQLVYDWAQKHGLRRSHKGCCPLWLQRPRNTRCATDRTCNRYGADTASLDRRWMDHTATWTFDKQPAAITSAPYSIHQEYRERLDWWAKEDPRLAVAYGGAGWYSQSTTQIILWRTDLVEVIEPA